MKGPTVLALVLASTCMLTAATAEMATAATVEIEIPKEGWSISFDSPPLSKKEESKKSGEYAFSANSGRFNLSLFVEKPRGTGTTNHDCFEYYWARGSQNPMIAKDTISPSETGRYARVQYDIVTTFQGKPFRDRNVNYYFIYRGKWVDVHISMGDPTAADDSIFKTFDASLRYGPTAGPDFKKGRNAYLKNDLKAAEKYFRAAVQAAPDSYIGHLYLGHSLFYQEKYQEALPEYQKAMDVGLKAGDMDNNDQRLLTDQLGMSLGIAGRLPEAKALFETAIKKDPAYAMYYYNLACAQAELGDLDGALASLKLGFEHRSEMLPGDKYPNPRGDDSFKKYLGNERFEAAMKQLGF